jgi:hypothetical protein
MTQQSENGSGVTDPQAKISAPESGAPSGASRVESKATEKQSDNRKETSKIEDLLNKNGINIKDLSQNSKSTFEEIIKKFIEMLAGSANTPTPTSSNNSKDPIEEMTKVLAKLL